MPVALVSIDTVLVIVAPLYGMMLDMWRRHYNHDNDIMGNEETNQNQADRLDEIETRLEMRLEEMERMLDEETASPSDIEQTRQLIDELHDDAKIIHDNLIEHNPCSYALATGDCPFCDTQSLDSSPSETSSDHGS